MFKVGQKVVCVDDRPTDADGGRCLTLGRIYTVRWCGMWGDFQYLARLCVRLAEIERGPDPWIPEVVDVPFNAARFRPVVSRPTSIEFAHEILRKATRTDEVTA